MISCDSRSELTTRRDRRLALAELKKRLEIGKMSNELGYKLNNLDCDATDILRLQIS